MKLIPLLHSTSSVQRLLDFARLVASLGLGELVVTKAYGAAAQHGLGELGRLAYKSNMNLVILPELSDAIDLLRPDIVLIVTRRGRPEAFDPLAPPRLEGRILVAFNGGDPDFSDAEVGMGKPIYPPSVQGRLGPAAEAALVLYPLLRSVGRVEEGG